MGRNEVIPSRHDVMKNIEIPAIQTIGQHMTARTDDRSKVFVPVSCFGAVLSASKSHKINAATPTIMPLIKTARRDVKKEVVPVPSVIANVALANMMPVKKLILSRGMLPLKTFTPFALSTAAATPIRIILTNNEGNELLKHRSTPPATVAARLMLITGFAPYRSAMIPDIKENKTAGIIGAEKTRENMAGVMEYVSMIFPETGES